MPFRRYLRPITLLAASICLVSCAPKTGGSAPDSSKASGDSAVATAKGRITYGSDSTAGATFTHDGVKLYYEVYGEGQPLLVVHGNGGNIASLWKQIEFFRKKYKVIAMDSREQGKSGGSTAPLTYEAMADDLAALLDHLKVDSADVLGWSDGGINGLLLAMRHPEKVKKLAAMAPNLDPEGMHPDTKEFFKAYMSSIPDSVRATPEGKRQLKVLEIVATQPNIKPAELHKITAPTLMMASDHDMVAAHHIVTMYEALPNAQLVIFPNATHMIPYDDPATFNAAVETFLSKPFVKRERIGDLLKTIEVMTKDLGMQ